jgi:dTDP-4-amino-4,6-dideoxygalactose transaminase
MKRVNFNEPSNVGHELDYIRQAIQQHQKLSGDGYFSGQCTRRLQEELGVHKALLTPSGSDALEMISLLLDLKPGDEIIFPSFTFVTTVSSFVLRGVVPVFVDIQANTLNIDPDQVERCITKKTKAIVAVHYGGVGADMPRLKQIADRHGVLLIEDAAHGFGAKYVDQYLGAVAPLGIYSFHETKNIHCGEGGALLINDPQYDEKASVIHSKGTNRKQFMEGKVDKYTWVGLGSSFSMSEMNAAFLLGQLDHWKAITQKREQCFWYYHEAFEDLEKQGHLRRPHIPAGCQTNGHLFYLILESNGLRQKFIQSLEKSGVESVFHYVPLHTSPAGMEYSKKRISLPVTEDLANRLVRLPMFYGLSEKDQDKVIEAVQDFYAKNLHPGRT